MTSDGAAALCLQFCLILSFLLASWAHLSERARSNFKRSVVRNLRCHALLMFFISFVSTLFMRNVPFPQQAALTMWDGPYEGLYLAGGNAGGEHGLLVTSQEACLITDGCEGVTRIASPDGSVVWQLRIGQGLWLEESPSGEVSYTWRQARKCLRPSKRDGPKQPQLKISALYYISQKPKLHSRDLLIDALLASGMPSGFFRRWVPGWSGDLVRWRQDIIHGELYPHLNIAQLISLQASALGSSNDWSLVLEDHVRPIISWDDLLARLWSTVCMDKDVGIVYLGANRRFRMGTNSSFERDGFIGTDAYAVKNDLAHQLFRLSQGWKRQKVIKDQLAELWRMSLPAPGFVARSGEGAFVARAGLNLTARPTRRYPHTHFDRNPPIRAEIIWTGPYDAAYLSGGVSGQGFACLDQAKDACLAEQDCHGVTSVKKKTGEIIWQMRIGSKMLLEHSKTGEVSYLWEVRNSHLWEVGNFTHNDLSPLVWVQEKDERPVPNATRDFRCYWNDELKFAFIHIPKNAGSAIINYMTELTCARAGGSNCFAESRNISSSYRMRVGKNCPTKTYFTFTFSRNPWSRAVSMWSYGLKKRQLKVKEPNYGSTLKKCNSYNTRTNDVSLNGGKELCEQANCHWIPGNYSGGSCVKMGQLEALKRIAREYCTFEEFMRILACDAGLMACDKKLACDAGLMACDKKIGKVHPSKEVEVCGSGHRSDHQYPLIFADNCEPAVHFVGRIEYFDRDFTTILKRIDKSGKMLEYYKTNGFSMSNDSGHKKYTDYYTDERWKEVVARYYVNDMKLGYTFDLGAHVDYVKPARYEDGFSAAELHYGDVVTVPNTRVPAQLHDKDPSLAPLRS
jgi:hypothetical protein